MTHILIPREPSTALLRPFIGCNTQELHEAWAAMVRIAEVQHARAGSQCPVQIEEPAAPAAVAGVAWGKTRDSLATLLLGLARRPFLDFDVACIALDAATEPGMPLAYMRGAPAAPALEAPAAPAPAVPDGWRLVPANPTDAMLGAAQKAWLADPLRRSSTLYVAALAAAPQAPRLGEDALHLLRRLLSNQHTLTGPEFRAELEKIVAEESARHAAAPQAPAVRAALSEGVILAVDKWFSQNTGLGGCSDKDAAELAAIFAEAPQAPAAPMDDLAQLVKQLVQALRKAAPNHALPAKALDYLRRQGLLGSPLRSAPAAPVAVEGVAQFRKRPVTISAIQWTGKNLREVITFTDGPPETRGTHAGMAWEAYTDLVARDGLKIYTLEGKMHASVGDWIIRGVKGEHYACKPDIFAETYEPVAAAPAAPAVDADPMGLRDLGEALMETIERNADALKAVGWLGPMDCPSEIVVDLLNLLEEANTTSALGEWVATLEVDSEGGLDYETVPPCTLPPGCYPLYCAAQAAKGEHGNG